MLENKETFFALSTPMGRSATATIRINGEKALATLLQLSNKKKLDIKHAKNILVNIYNKNNDLIDNVVTTYYKKPKSYTGEDLIEIHTHGNPTIINTLSKELLELGVRPAEPGEFTKTAYLNGKMDLIQAESVLLLINSTSASGVNLSLNNVVGFATNELQKTKNNLISALGLLEYELDISETENQTTTTKNVHKTIHKTVKNVKRILSSGQASKILTSGARIVICGEPNTGKSTLFNALIKHERAIVTDIPGTTRDTIEEGLILNKNNVVLVDTAGLRPTKNLVEKKGIERTKDEIKNADIVLSLFDFTTKENKRKNNKNTLYIINKVDLLDSHSLNKLMKQNPGFVFISAKEKQGIDKLLLEIEKCVFKITAKNNSLFLTSKRQENVLFQIQSELEPLVTNNETNLELLAHHTKKAIGIFDNLLGKTTADDVLDSVFSGFCVGK
ncbi:tRNA uridine-5-carboxymethylaminomethyl(34) synthesis GTPase MnmE [bacterium]|nr:tRNA uridine-5-carboxymethylaminomethyl(34) synthesis GTPase MnmE [bacterium]MBT4250276.1 tRNA uridine-5-carboxymethylaminomethyl(34) synthesis GTPase MnmE [bacterium]